MRLEPPVKAAPILFLRMAGQLQFSSAGAGFEPASLSHACDLILAARRSCRSVFDAAPLRLFVRLGTPSPPCHWLRIHLRIKRVFLATSRPNHFFPSLPIHHGSETAFRCGKSNSSASVGNWFAFLRRARCHLRLSSFSDRQIVIPAIGSLRVDLLMIGYESLSLMTRISNFV